MTTISLNHNWQCIYAEPDIPVPAFTGSHTVDSISNWSHEQSHLELSAWLKHMFLLEPTDYCVNYVLRVAAVPIGTTLYLNGERIDNLTGDAPYEVDTTLNVALGENDIIFCVASGAEGHFAGVELHPIPCD